MDIKNLIYNKIKELGAKGKRAVKTGIFCGIACSLAILFSINFTFSYTVYLGGEKIGAVTNKEAFGKAYEDANALISELDNSYNRLSYIPKYFYGISRRGELADEYQLKSNILSLSQSVRSACIINVDGAEITRVNNEETAKTVLEKVRVQYGSSNAEIISDITLTNGFSNIKNIRDDVLAAYELGVVAKVQTEEINTYAESVPYGTEYVNNESLYEGQSLLVSDGSAGTKTVSAKITKINGIEAAREVVSETVETSAVAQVVQVGTKKKTGIGSGQFLQPTFGTVTSRFGARWGRRHNGLDIANDTGTPVTSADNGVVTYAGYKGDFGNLIIINHNNGYETYYAHLSAFDVCEGETVISGQKIGEVGNTGYSTGPHLHFEVRKNGVPENPSNYLK